MPDILKIITKWFLLLNFHYKCGKNLHNSRADGQYVFMHACMQSVACAVFITHYYRRVIKVLLIMTLARVQVFVNDI